MLAFDPTYGQWARRRLRTRPQQTLGKLRAFAEYCEAECTRRGLGDVDGELEDEDDEDDEDGEDEDEDEDETDGVASARSPEEEGVGDGQYEYRSSRIRGWVRAMEAHQR